MYDWISIHALLAESDLPRLPMAALPQDDFYPRSPCGERPRRTSRCRLTLRFLSTLSLRRATKLCEATRAAYEFLSTLSLRRATFSNTTKVPGMGEDFYPRSPCGERRFTSGSIQTDGEFLSTLSLRRATYRSIDRNNVGKISIHALLAESDCLRLARTPARDNFYPRSPCGERHASTTAASILAYFYPRSPCGERRYTNNIVRVVRGISIHALLAESDWRGAGYPPQLPNFYPRSPCGERPASYQVNTDSYLFLSTLSLRRATGLGLIAAGLYRISIHALLAESDNRAKALPIKNDYFYPRSPCGERPPRFYRS